jgi:hypothetical protein
LLQVAERQGVASRDFLEMRVYFPIVAEVSIFWGIFRNHGRLSEEAFQEKLEIFNGFTQRRGGRKEWVIFGGRTIYLLSSKALPVKLPECLDRMPMNWRPFTAASKRACLTAKATGEPIEQAVKT